MFVSQTLIEIAFRAGLSEYLGFRPFVSEPRTACVGSRTALLSMLKPSVHTDSVCTQAKKDEGRERGARKDVMGKREDHGKNGRTSSQQVNFAFFEIQMQ